LGSSTALAPDEREYLKVFEQLYSKDFSLLNVDSGWNSSNETFLKIIYSPAFILVKLGLSNLFAIRILSIIFSFLIITLLCKIYFSNNPRKRKIPPFIAIGVLIPTYFIWTSLALRESLYLFLITIIFFFIFKFETRVKYLYLGILIVLYSSLFLTKPYIFLLLVTAIFMSFVLRIMIHKKIHRNNLIFTIVSLAPLLLIFSITQEQVQVIMKQGSSYNEVSTFRDKTEPIKINSTTAYELNKEKINPKNYSLFLKFISKLPYENYSEGISNYSTARPTDPYSVLRSSLKFVFFPHPLRNNGTFLLNLVSIEFVLWIYVYYKLIVYLNLLRKRYYGMRNSQMILIIFLILFIIFSALTEVNTGTSLRHRSLLLILILILLSSKHKTERIE
jgi:hypothetical protein